MTSDLVWIKNGSPTSPMGFRAAGISSGIKKSSAKDLALVFSDCEAEVGATFTTNLIKAAPVKLSMQHVRGGQIRGVILNSGNANACTGLRGINDAKEMAELTSELMGVKRREILVCSTGRIGVPLPMDVIRKGIRKITKKVDHLSGQAAAKAIMTSDTVSKTCALALQVNGRRVVIGAMCKGAGMIHPNMATMLACITTDAAIERETLQRITYESVEASFNRISVDGDTSTNDTVMVLANGLAGNTPLAAGHRDLGKFQSALKLVMQKLARMIVEDGEGISHVVEVIVQGAANAADARRISEAIARSPLIKSSWCGGDPNWGRLMCAMGYSGAKAREELVDIYYNGLLAVKGGLVTSIPRSKLAKVVAKRSYTITLDLHLGKGSYRVFVNDLTEKYVTLNKGE